MPKSKRNKVVTLSKTKKKGREHKESIVSGIRDAVEKYASIYVFTFENMRNLKFKEFRDSLKSSSRFFLGSNKVMQISLGRMPAEEVREGIHKVSKMLHGTTGLLFTNLQKEEVERLFEEYREHDFARTGSVATQTVRFSVFGSDHDCCASSNAMVVSRDLKNHILYHEPGKHYSKIYKHHGREKIQACNYDLKNDASLDETIAHGSIEHVELKEGPLHQFTHEMEPFLRKQGMPVRLNKGVIELVSDYMVCEEGKPLSPESARILRLLGVEMAVFRLHLICRWSSGDFEVYRDGPIASDIGSS